MRPGRYDVAIVGGGLIGLATAYRLLEAHLDLRLVVLEKERSSRVTRAGATPA